MAQQFLAPFVREIRRDRPFVQAPSVLRNAASVRRPRIEVLLEAQPQARDGFRSLW